MVDRSDNHRESAKSAPSSGAEVTASEVDAWFGREVLPLEPVLMQYLQHNWRNSSEIADLRQEVYVRVYASALEHIPERPKQFVFATARHLLIDLVRQRNVVPIEAAADLEALEIAADAPGPEHVAIARDDLRHLRAAMEELPPRCREVIVLRRIHGLSRAEIAQRMGVTEGTVSQHLAYAVRQLTDRLYSEFPKTRRKL